MQISLGVSSRLSPFLILEVRKPAMPSWKNWLPSVLGACLFCVASANAQAPSAGIAWYGVWEDALQEARRTNRPILLISAAPHCHNVSGIW